MTASAADAYQPAIYNLTNNKQSTKTAPARSAGQLTYGDEQPSISRSPARRGTPASRQAQSRSRPGTRRYALARSRIAQMARTRACFLRRNFRRKLRPGRLLQREFRLSGVSILLSASRCHALPLENRPSLSATKLTYGREQSERFSVTVSPQHVGSPAGTVTIKTGAVTLCTVTLTDGKSSCRLSSKDLKPGTYKVVARYKGDVDFAGSTSKPASLTVNR
jgi:hypothetical protein